MAVEAWHSNCNCADNTVHIAAGVLDIMCWSVCVFVCARIQIRAAWDKMENRISIMQKLCQDFDVVLTLVSAFILRPTLFAISLSVSLWLMEFHLEFSTVRYTFAKNAHQNTGIGLWVDLFWHNSKQIPDKDSLHALRVNIFNATAL